MERQKLALDARRERAKLQYRNAEDWNSKPATPREFTFAAQVLARCHVGKEAKEECG